MHSDVCGFLVLTLAVLALYTLPEMQRLPRTLIQMLIFFCALASAGTAFAQATAIRGLIDTSSGSLAVLTREGVHYHLTTASAQVKAGLVRLQQGDFLVARGSIDELSRRVRIEAIESLGLKTLIGTWTSERSEVYEFRDFTRLNLYIPDQGWKKIEIAGQYHYSVAPDRGSRYSIFLSDNKSVLVGSFEFKERNLHLTLLDPKTGRVSQNISLSPLTVK